MGLRTKFAAIAIAALAVIGAGSAVAAGTASVSAAPVNHCSLWANRVLHPHPHCYANETPAEKAPYFYGP